MFALLSGILSILISVTIPANSSRIINDKISPEERAALVAFFEATGGPHWIHKDGWLGPSGSECDWYGVQCGKESSGPLAGKLSVQGLELPNNGLAGSVPPDSIALIGLNRLILRGNSIRGPIPEELLQKFDDGILHIDPLSLIDDVEYIIFSFESPSVACSGYDAHILANGSVHLARRDCGRGKSGTHFNCRIQEGRTPSFDILGRYLIRTGFFSKLGSSETFVGSDMEQMSVSAKRKSKPPVTYTTLGVSSLSDWSLSMVLEGVISTTTWEGSAVKTVCSSSLH